MLTFIQILVFFSCCCYAIPIVIMVTKHEEAQGHLSDKLSLPSFFFYETKFVSLFFLHICLLSLHAILSPRLPDLSRKFQKKKKKHTDHIIDAPCNLAAPINPIIIDQ